MLDLRKGAPPAAAVDIGGGAIVFVRPATAFDVEKASAFGRTHVAGLMVAEEAASVAAAALGEEFAGADFAAPEWQAAAAERLALLELATVCIESWSGICVDGEAVDPSREIIALLLRDPAISDRIRKAIDAGVHMWRAEAKKSPALLIGAGEAGEGTAPNAGHQERPAPPGGGA